MRVDELFKRTLIASMVVGMAACGGGGGDDDDDGVPVGDLNDVTAQEAAAYTVELVGQLAALSDATSVLPIVNALEVPPRTEECDGGGSIDFVVDDVDGDGTESVGDVMTVTFNNCVNEAGDDPINGVLEATLTEDGTTWGESDIELIGLGIGGVTYNTTGGPVKLKILQDGTLFRNELSGGPVETRFPTSAGEMVATSTGPASEDPDLEPLPLVSVVTDENTGEVRVAADGTVSGSLFGTSLGFVMETLEEFSLLSGDDAPTSGEVEGTGSDNSRVNVAARDTSSVLVNFDGDGDGTDEVVDQVFTYDQLDSVFGGDDSDTDTDTTTDSDTDTDTDTTTDSDTDTDTDTDSDSTGDIVAGETVYLDNCQDCHGPAPGTIDTPADQYLVDLGTSSTLDFSIYNVAMTGIVLTSNQVVNLVAYLNSL